MDKSDREVIKTILQYKESLVKYSSDKNVNEHKLVHYIGKLYNIPVKIAYLEETGIGLTVNGLRKLGGEVSEVAKALIAKWKKMVVAESDTKTKDTKDSNRKQDTSKEAHKERDDKHHKSKSSHSGTYSKSDLSRSKHSTKEHSEDSKKHNHHKHNGDSNSNKHNNKRKHESSSDSNDEEEEISKSKYRKHSSKQKYTHSESEDTNSDMKINGNRSLESSGSELEEVFADKYKSKHEISTHHHQEKEKKTSSKGKETSTDRDKNLSHKKEPKQKRKKEETESDEEDEEETPVVVLSSKSKREKDMVDHRHRVVEEKHKKRSKTVETIDSSSKTKSRHSAHASSSKHSSKEKHRNDRSAKPEGEKKTKTDKRGNSEKKPKSKTHGGESGIDSGSGASFAEALGMLAPGSSKSSPKKKVVVSSPVRKDKSPLPSKSRDELSPPKLLKEPKLEPLDINISSLLPTITPNYRPLGNVADSVHQRNKVVSEDEALCRVMSSKNQRTKVYSGNKCSWNAVPTLFELCTRVLQDNIDALEYTGGVPYIILKPVLERATPDQLFTLEHHNPYLIEDTNELWQLHCMKEFKNKRREELESWREMYMRCLDEREAKLQALTANIKQSQDKSLPVRQTKLAYVDSFVKPPREVARKQAKNGIKTVVTPSARLATLATAGAAGHVAVPNPGPRAAERSSGSSANGKPKKAPLMQKALALIKNRFKR